MDIEKVSKHRTTFIVLAICFTLLGVVVGFISVGAYGKYAYYKDAYDETIVSEEKTISEDSDSYEYHPAKSKMDNPNPYDINIDINEINGSSWERDDMLSASKHLWDITGIQLYFIRVDIGISGIKSGVECKDYVNDHIKNIIPNYEYSICVVTTDSSNDNSSYDIFGLYDYIMYGDKVVGYLTADDMRYISYVMNNYYTLFRGSNNRKTDIWKSIGSYIVSESYNSTADLTDKEFDVEFYKDSYEGYNMYTTLFFILMIIAFVFAIIFFVLFIVNQRLVSNYMKSLSDAVILEADVDYINNDGQGIIDRYLE